MILLQSPSRYLLQILTNRVQKHQRRIHSSFYYRYLYLRHLQKFVLSSGLPLGAIEAIKSAYGVVAQILDPPRDGFNLTAKLNLSKLPPDEEYKLALLVKIASIRELVLGSPLRMILKHLASRRIVPNLDELVALMHRPMESFFVIPQEFVEARRSAGLNNAPVCLWSSSPLELKGASEEALSVNAGFVTFVVFPRHVEGKKLDNCLEFINISCIC